LDQRRRLGAPVRLDEAEHDVDAALLEGVRLLQHAVGLADSGGEAEVDLEPAALAALHQLEEVLGAALALNDRVVQAGHCPLRCVATPNSAARATTTMTCSLPGSDHGANSGR